MTLFGRHGLISLCMYLISYLIISITLALNFQHLNRNMYLVLNFNKIGCKYFLFIFQKAFLSLKSLCIWVRWYYFICFCDYRHCCTSCVGVHGLFWGLFRYFKTRYFCQKLGTHCSGLNLNTT